MKRRILFFIVGLIILTFGVVLIIQSNVGASPWDALAVGESKVFNISVGSFVFINGIILILINSILLKEKPDILSAITVFVIGRLIDFWLVYVFTEYSPEGSVQKFASLFTGILILGIGVPMYLQAKFPSSPMDNIMVAIHRRFGLSLRISRIISEGSALVLAYLFGGPIGIGTIIVTISLGPVVQFFYQRFETLLLRKQPSRSTV